MLPACDRQQASGQVWYVALQIVPTDYFTRIGVVLETSQYSVTEYSLPLDTGPGLKMREPYVDLVYDFSPIIITINESPLSLLHFIVRCCAVVGGAYSVTGMLDKLIHAFMKRFGPPHRRSSGGGGGSSVGTPTHATSSLSNGYFSHPTQHASYH